MAVNNCIDRKCWNHFQFLVTQGYSHMTIHSRPDFIPLEVHSSCFPEVMAERMMRELRAGRMPQVLHYQGAAQSARWKQLYEAWSPYKRSEEYRSMYGRCFEAVAGRFKGRAVVVGIGCGTGDKEHQLVAEFEKRRTSVDLALVDASQTLLLTAVMQFSRRPGVHEMFPLIADLEGLDEINSWLDAKLGDSVPRLFTCFSVLPNFRPNTLLGCIAKWMREEDRLLVSVNLAPGDDSKWPDRILPQYDNAETRQWLLTTLDQGGVSPSSGKLEFTTDACQEDARTVKIGAQWRFQSDAKFFINDSPVEFHAGSSMELFFSCRYREGVVEDQLREQGLSVCDAWQAPNGEEVIHLCRSVVLAK